MEVNNKEHLEQIQSIKHNDQSELRQDGNLVEQTIIPDIEEQKPFTTIGEHSRNAVVKRRARMKPLIEGLRKWLAAKKEKVQNKIAVDVATTDTSVQCERRLRPNGRDSLCKGTATGSEEDKLIIREKARIRKAKQRAKETEKVKLIIREKERIAKAKRRAAEKEKVKLIKREKELMAKLLSRRATEKVRKRSEVLPMYTSEAEIGTVIDKVKVQEGDEDAAAETQRETEKTLSRKLKLAREKWAHKRANETEKERSSRLERERIQRARRVAFETDEQQFIRLDRARIAAAKRIVAEDLRLENMQISADQQQQELMNFLTEVNKDQQTDIGIQVYDREFVRFS